MLGNAKREALLALFAIALGAGCRIGLAADDIVIGNIASTTNFTSRQNVANLLLGYTIYLEHVNRQGGVHGRKIRLLNRDDGVDPAKMVELTEELIATREVIALAGFLNTPGLVELARKNILAQRKIALIAPISAMGSPNFYPLRPGYNDEMEKLLREAHDTQKKRVGLVYFNQAYGPSLFKFAQETAKKIGVDVIATAGFETTPDKMDAGISAAVRTLSGADPDAVVVIAAGIGAYNFVRQFREATEKKFVQIYTLSTADPVLLVKTAGLENARGVVISQAMPYPQNKALAVVREYQKMMQLYAADRTPAFFSLEGFMGAKIAVEALRRAGPNPTREKVIAALNTMKEFDLGDFLVSYSSAERVGSKLVDLTIIGGDGALYR